MRLATFAADDFFEFIRKHDGQIRGQHPLSVYISAWFESGRAIEETGGQFHVYMQSVLLVIQRLHEDPTLLHLLQSGADIPRSMSGIVYSDGGWADERAECFDPEYFQDIVFKYHRCKT